MRNPTPIEQRVRFPGDGSAEALFAIYDQQCHEWARRREERYEDADDAETDEDRQEILQEIEHSILYARHTRCRLTLGDISFFAEVVSECYRELPDDVPAKNLRVRVNANRRTPRTREEGVDSILLTDSDDGVVHSGVRRVQPMIKFETTPIDPTDDARSPGAVLIICRAGRGDRYADSLESAGWYRIEMQMADPYNMMRRAAAVREFGHTFGPPKSLVDSLYLMETSPLKDPARGRYVRWRT